MKSNLCLLTAFVLMFFSAVAFAQQPQQDEPDIYERAEMEADRLQRVLDLEDWQTFYVDSTLKHDYPALMEEIDALKAAKVSNNSLYVAVQDKWMEKIDESYRRIFTDQQWAAYLKSGAAKIQKAREKRKTKAAGTKN